MSVGGIVCCSYRLLLGGTMIMLRNIIGITCILFLPSSMCRAQDSGEEIFAAVIKSIEVLEKSLLESFELEMTRNQTHRIETIFRLGKNHDVDSDIRRLYRIVRSKKDDEFSIAASSGCNRLTITSGEGNNGEQEKSDEQVDFEELSDTYFIYGKNGEAVTGRLSRNDVSIQRGTLLEKLVYVFALEGGCKFPIIQITEQSNTGTKRLDPLIDFCSDSQNQSRITKSEEDTTEGKVRVYRIKHHPEPDHLFAQKIVVSDEGFDKGLIRENQIGFLRHSQYNLPYTSEKQLTSELIQSVRIKWKEVALGDDPNKPLVVPERVAKSSTVIRAVKGTKSDITQFDWKPLSEEAKKKISLEEAKKTTEEQVKTIDKMLQR